MGGRERKGGPPSVGDTQGRNGRLLPSLPTRPSPFSLLPSAPARTALVPTKRLRTSRSRSLSEILQEPSRDPSPTSPVGHGCPHEVTGRPGRVVPRVREWVEQRLRGRRWGPRRPPWRVLFRPDETNEAGAHRVGTEGTAGPPSSVARLRSTTSTCAVPLLDSYPHPP